MLDVRDGAIDEQAWLRAGGYEVDVDTDLLGSYRFLLARIEVLIDSAIRDEGEARVAGEQMSEVVAALLTVATEMGRDDVVHLQRLLQLAKNLEGALSLIAEVGPP